MRSPLVAVRFGFSAELLSFFMRSKLLRNFSFVKESYVGYFDTNGAIGMCGEAVGTRCRARAALAAALCSAACARAVGARVHTHVSS